jgi:hypothetical protein
VHESERNKLTNSIRLLSFAVGDFKVARAAALMRSSEEIADRDLRHAIDTGMTVAYARSFTNDNKGRSLDRALDGPDDDALRDIHDRLLAMRDEFYAHNDTNSPRQEIVEGPIAFSSWPEISPHVFPEIVALCDAQIEAFTARIRAANAQLYAARSERTTGIPRNRTVTVYHHTSAASAILEYGFHDLVGLYAQTRAGMIVGVAVSDVPLDRYLDTTAYELLAVDVPEGELLPYEFEESGKPYREFRVPAEVLNRCGPARLVNAGDMPPASQTAGQPDSSE